MSFRRVLKIYSELSNLLPSSVFWGVVVSVFTLFLLSLFLLFYDLVTKNVLGVVRDFIIFLLLFLFLWVVHVGSRNIYILVRAFRKLGIYQYPIVRLEDFGVYIEKNVRILLSKLNSLVKENTFIHNALDTIPIGLIILDEDDLIVFCNSFIKNFFGVSRDYTGDKVKSLIFEKSLLDAVKNVEDGAKIVSVNLQGVEKSLKVSGLKVDSRKVVFIEDITDMVNLENTLSLTTSIISHEVNTPLTNIQLVFENLLLSLNIPKELEKIMSSNLHRLRVVMANITSLSNVIANKSVLLRKNFNLKEMLQEILESFCVDYASRNLKFRLSYEAQEEVYGDSDKFNLLLTNVIENAFKFSKEFGEVEVKVYTKDYGKLCIEVLNEVDKEIPDSEIKNVFNKFYRAQNSYTIKGKGLGLYISKLLCDMMSMEIKITSEGKKVIVTVSDI